MSEITLHNRRNFIKNMGLVAGGALLTIPWLQQLQAANLPDNATKQPHKVRLGVVGTGSRGNLLLQILKTIPEAQIVALCDNYVPNLTQAHILTNKKAKLFNNYNKLLELNEVDAVIIATPLHTHANITIAALNAGKHVFCEKSMARTIPDCYKMYNTHLQTKKILHIGHQRLFSPKYTKGIAQIKAGEIGKITQIKAYWHRNNNWRRPVPKPELERKINWRLYHEYSCGLMTELASHQIQVANWILGTVPISVMGVGGINYWNDGREVADNVALIYTYPNGVQLIYDSIISNAHYGLEEQIIGSKGTAELEMGKMFTENPPPASGFMQLVNQIEHKVFDVIPIGGPSWIPETANEDKGKYIIDKVQKSDGTDFQMEAFIASVRENKITPGLAEEGLNASVAALMGFNAITQNKVIMWQPNLK